MDNSVAELYRVETKRINEAVSRNPEKFPEGYLIELTADEWAPLKSQIATSKKGGKVKLPFLEITRKITEIVDKKGRT